jgi:hypothetical protein
VDSWEWEKLGVFHAALEQSIHTSGKETTGPEICFAEGVVVGVGARGGDVFWVVGWGILEAVSSGLIKLKKEMLPVFLVLGQLLSIFSRRHSL